VIASCNLDIFIYLIRDFICDSSQFVFSLRETIPEEDQNEIFSEVYPKLHEMEIIGRKQKHKRIFIKPKKTG